jgi:hypothetical protein
MFVRSVHIRHFSFFFLTMMMFASHNGYFTSLMKHVSSNLCTSAFAAFTFPLPFCEASASLVLHLGDLQPMLYDVSTYSH